MSMLTDTIAAIATPPGRGGVGIVRVSGGNALAIAKQLTQKTLTPRYASYGPFFDESMQALDLGISLYFKAPHSFTGEDVFECQAHGGPIVLDALLQRILSLGARLARPGEFTERAFMNDKIDLAQAEAVADLINSSSEQAARSALRSLQGVFSSQINAFNQELIELRMFIEASLDFPDEELDLLASSKITERLAKLNQTFSDILAKTRQGVLLREGISVVIAGSPNAGKSTLLNQLTGQDTAIVTDIAGTTRDVMREQIVLDGLPVQLIDTAGLRDSDCLVEQIGIRRAREVMASADALILVVDASKKDYDLAFEQQNLLPDWPEHIPIIYVLNKIDQLNQQPAKKERTVSLSAKEGQGIELLIETLKELAGFSQLGEDQFIARRRHLDAFSKAKEHIDLSAKILSEGVQLELVADELRQAQLALNQITGEFGADDLLGEIFSRFCIGK